MMMKHVLCFKLRWNTFSLSLYNEFILFIDQKVHPRNTPGPSKLKLQNSLASIFCFSPLQTDSIICDTIEI